MYVLERINSLEVTIICRSGGGGGLSEFGGEEFGGEL